MRDDREPHERWFTRGTGIGVLLGVLLGLVLGDIILGLMIGVIMGAGIGVLANPRNRDERKDRDGRDEPDGRPRRRWRGDDGAMDRGVMWLLAGLGVAIVLLFVTAPELLFADALELGELLLVVFAAAIPGLAVVAYVAFRRRGQADDEEPDDA